MDRAASDIEPQISPALLCAARNCGLAGARVYTKEMGWLRVCPTHGKQLADAGEICEPPALVRLQTGAGTPAARPVRPAEDPPLPLIVNVPVQEYSMSRTRTLTLRTGADLDRADRLGHCRIAGCEKPAKHRGLCEADRQAARKAGRTDELGLPPKLNVLSKRQAKDTNSAAAELPQAVRVDVPVMPVTGALPPGAVHASLATKKEELGAELSAATASGVASPPVPLPTPAEERALGEGCIAPSADQTCHDPKVWDHDVNGVATPELAGALDELAQPLNGDDRVGLTAHAAELLRKPVPRPTVAQLTALHRDIVEYWSIPVPLDKVLRWEAHDVREVEEWNLNGQPLDDLPGILTVDIADTFVAWWRQLHTKKKTTPEGTTRDLIHELRMRADAMEHEDGWEQDVLDGGEIIIRRHGRQLVHVAKHAPRPIRDAAVDGLAKMKADAWLAREQHVSREWALSGLQDLEAMIHGEIDQTISGKVAGA